jgi:hypothetical protein
MDEDREKVNAVLSPYVKWAIIDCEYTIKEAEFIIGTELENEIFVREEKIRILKLAKRNLQDEGL